MCGWLHTRARVCGWLHTRAARATKYASASSVARGQAVDRPPTEVHRLVADRDLGAGRGMGHELQIKMAGRHTQRAGDRVDVHGDQVGFDAQAVDAGFFGGLAQRCRHDVGVGILAVAAQLDPPPQPRMQRQQHLTAGVVEHQRRRGDMSRHARAKAGVVARVQKRQHRVPQRILLAVRRLPLAQQRDGRLANAHLRTSRSLSGTGSRGSVSGCSG